MHRLSFALASVLLGGVASAQDLDVSIIGAGVNNYGSSNGLQAYSFSTTSCNVGSVEVLWNDSINQAPVIAQNMFRLHDGRFEQLGYSFLKEGFCAVNENSCGSCQFTDCNTLGIGCADTYGAGLNDGQGGVTKSQINATTGSKPNSLQGPSSGNSTLRGRLQVERSKLQDNGARFFIESQYVSEHDQMAGNGRNNASWRECNVSQSTFNLSMVGGTRRDDPAIYAWQDVDPDVTIAEVVNVDEGGAGVHGYFFVGVRAYDLGGGMYRYEYAVQNMTSDASAKAFRVDLPCSGVATSNPVFQDVDYHSGDPYDGTDWTFAANGSQIEWTGPDFNSTPNGNALRWGTLYNFAFEANAAPVMGTVSLDLFKTNGTLQAQLPVPGSSMEVYCAANLNSIGFAADIDPTGSVSIAANDVNFLVFNLPPNSNGYFLMSQGQQFVPNFSGSAGNLCIGSATDRIYRFSLSALNSGLFGFVNFSPDLTNLPEGVVFMPGETWNFQYWYRDQPSTSNTSPGVEINFCQ